MQYIKASVLLIIPSISYLIALSIVQHMVILVIMNLNMEFFVLVLLLYLIKNENLFSTKEIQAR